MDNMSYFSRVSQYIETIEPSIVYELLNSIWKTHNSAKIFTIGNGGSISTAAHFANDLKSLSSGFQVICLNDANTMSCIANDRGYDLVFYEQILSLAIPGDLVIMLSASGNSPNLLKAIDACRYNCVSCAGIVGFDGGEVKKLVDICVHVNSPLGQYREVEDCHSILCHYIVDQIDKAMQSIGKVPAGFNRGSINMMENLINFYD